jgi:protein-disulfide isomerase
MNNITHLSCHMNRINIYDARNLIAIAAVTILGLIIFMIQDTTPSPYYASKVLAQKQEQKSITDMQLSLSSLINEGSPHLGELSAPITLIDFSDFQCHLCARYVKNTEPLINETYIQTGQVALVFKHLPNRGFDSMSAHLAAQCTNDQAKFWQIHKLLYENQQAIDSGWINKDNLRKFAFQIPELNIKQFNSCFDTQKYEEFINKDIELANSYGFFDTPSFIIANSIDGSDPEIIRGAQPFSAFQSVIDKKLKEFGQ